MKIPCSRCHALIMPETAARTGGLCMPCKSGTRAHIDAAKIAAERERELDASDPFRIHCRQLVARVVESPSGLAQLSEVEKQYWAVDRLFVEVHNGGFHQYFFNSSSESYSAAVDGLAAMAATTSLLLLQKAKQMIFGFAVVPIETVMRRTIVIGAESDSLQERLNRLDEQFWQDPDGMEGRIKAFALSRGLVRLT